MIRPVRVRFAPSPTGYLHVGSARTALFNWLFARHEGGSFVLRIEDTDTARNRPAFVHAIADGLAWLGLDWDEGPGRGPRGPYVQSERKPWYDEAAVALQAKGLVYECVCTRDRFAPAHADAPCRCDELSAAERRNLAGAGGAALRFRTNNAEPITVEDVVRGTVTFPAASVDDFIIVKADGSPVYNFAAVVDDRAMEITHVIRGEEHLANTPRQLLLYRALGWPPPLFAHIPIILNEQRRKLSKRDGAAFVNDYRTMGYLAPALVNFLALLGWSPGDDREIMTRDELIGDFALHDVVKHPAIFDHAKLAWMNKVYIERSPPAAIAAGVALLLGPAADNAAYPMDYIERVTALFHKRVHTLRDIVEQGAYFFTNAAPKPDPDALQKYCSSPDALQRLAELSAVLEPATDFSAAAIETALRGLAARRERKAAEYIHVLRVALTGQAVSPGIFDVAGILGRHAVCERIAALAGRLRRHSALKAALGRAAL